MTKKTFTPWEQAIIKVSAKSDIPITSIVIIKILDIFPFDFLKSKKRFKIIFKLMLQNKLNRNNNNNNNNNSKQRRI